MSRINETAWAPYVSGFKHLTMFRSVIFSRAKWEFLAACRTLSRENASIGRLGVSRCICDRAGRCKTIMVALWISLLLVPWMSFLHSLSISCHDVSSFSVYLHQVS